MKKEMNIFIANLTIALTVSYVTIGKSMGQENNQYRKNMISINVIDPVIEKRFYSAHYDRYIGIDNQFSIRASLRLSENNIHSGKIEYLYYGLGFKWYLLNNGSNRKLAPYFGPGLMVGKRILYEKDGSKQPRDYKYLVLSAPVGIQWQPIKWLNISPEFNPGIRKTKYNNGSGNGYSGGQFWYYIGLNVGFRF